MPTKITREVIEAAEPGARISDSIVEGLTLKVSRTGKRSWTLRYRHAGERHEYSIGSAAALTASQAREHARRQLNQLAGGTAPLEAKAAAKEATLARKSRITVAEFRETYQRTTTKKPLTKDSDDSIFDKWLIPLLGNVPIKDVGREHAQQLHAAVTDAGFRIRANRAFALLSHVVSEAARRGLREGPLPRGIVRKNEETRRERYLSAPESLRLWKALTALQKPTKKGRPGPHADAALALKLLMLTGCRKREILNLRWDEVDIEGACLRLADSKTGRRVVPLGPAALEPSVDTQKRPYIDT